MDPWGGKEVDSSGINSSCQNLFDDNFFPDSPGCLVPSQRPTNYQPLHDSEEYLSNLERKLSKLRQKPTKNSLQERRDLLFSLSGTREGHIDRLLNLPEASQLEFEDSDISSDSLTSSLIRHIAPHRQAVTTGELIELLKDDQLNRSNSIDKDIQEPAEKNLETK